MSFRRRQFLALTLLLVIIMSANFVVNTYSAKSYFSAQLEVLAADAATSLAFSISQSRDTDGIASTQSMIDAVFDSGYYLSINYVDLEGNIVISKSRTIDVENVPAWFVDLVDVPLSVGVAEVQRGWQRLGEIRVVAHPGFVVRDLWQAIVELFWFYCFVLVLSYALMGLLLNYLTRPLKALEQQAESVFSDDYVALLKLPKETEFRSLALAMNRMIERVRSTFQRQTDLTAKLRKELSVDPLTKLPNREELDSQMLAWLESDEGDGPGVLCFVSLLGLAEINAKFGRESGDDALKGIAAVVKAHANKHRYVIFGRRSGTDFGVFVPGMVFDEGVNFVSAIREDVRLLPKLAALPPECTRLGFGAAYTEARTRPQQLYIAADDALRRYIATERLALLRADNDGAALTAYEWREVLQKAIDQDKIVLLFHELHTLGSEPAGAKETGEAHFEVLCRLDGDVRATGVSASEPSEPEPLPSERAVDGPTTTDLPEPESLPAAAFWPLLERFDLSSQMDMIVIIRSLSYLEKFPALKLSVNVSSTSVMSQRFREWLIHQVSLHEQGVRARLTIELKEAVFEYYDDLKTSLFDPLAGAKVAVGVDGFGRSTSVISRMGDFAADYLKLDRRFTHGIDSSKSDRFYLITLVSLCKQNNIRLVAEGVERPAQLKVLQALGVESFQGFHFGLPKNEYELGIGL